MNTLKFNLKLSRLVLYWGLILMSVAMLSACQSTGSSSPSPQSNYNDAVQINSEVDNALRQLYATTPSARYLASRAKGILVFPNVLKAGFIGGAEYGKGAMRINGRPAGYYKLVAGSYGLQAGVQTFGYAMFFMNNSAIDALNDNNGFEVGIGPSVVIMDEGKAKKITNMTLRDDVYAFVFGQRGLMAGAGLQGSKISRINP